MKRNQVPILALLAALLAAVVVGGCASSGKVPPSPVEDAAETWKAMEKQSQGHSPRGQFVLGEPPVVIHSPAQQPLSPRQPVVAGQAGLPTSKMSLRMHNAEVSAVLQALARAAGKSIVLSPGVTGTVNMNIVERPWDEIFTGILAASKLAYSFEGDTIRVMALTDMQAALDLETLRRKAVSERNAALKEGPLSTSVARVRFADAKMLQKTVEGTLAKDKDGKPMGSVLVDELTNSLIIQSVDDDMPKITRLLSRLDSPRAQIKLKAHIVETTKETARELGILWGGSYTGNVKNGYKAGVYSGGSTTVESGVSTTTYALGQSLSATGLGVRLPSSTVTTDQTGLNIAGIFGKTGGSVLEVQLQALQQDNKLNIISSPSIATMDNQKAYTEAGERVPYQSITGTGTNITTSVNFQDAVLRLEITPHIIDDDFIKLQVLIQKDEVDTSRTVSGNPYIVKKKTETTLIARNGETVVISGLSKLKNKLNEAGVPGVMDIPGAGWLAKSQSKDDLKDEFMIFITPSVLADWKTGERQKTYEELEQEILAKRKAEEERLKNGGDNATEPAPRPAPPARPESKQPKEAPLSSDAAPANLPLWARPGRPTLGGAA